MTPLFSYKSGAFDQKGSVCEFKQSETLAETFESGPLCITDLFKNKSVAYFEPIIIFL